MDAWETIGEGQQEFSGNETSDEAKENSTSQTESSDSPQPLNQFQESKSKR